MDVYASKCAMVIHAINTRTTHRHFSPDERCKVVLPIEEFQDVPLRNEERHSLRLIFSPFLDFLFTHTSITLKEVCHLCHSRHKIKQRLASSPGEVVRVKVGVEERSLFIPWRIAISSVGSRNHLLESRECYCA
eukprot:330052-Prorocentrum_minimum.AAC.11